MVPAMKPLPKSLKLFLTIAVSGIVLSGCSSTPAPKKSIDNICSIFYYEDDWKDGAQNSYHKWGTPPWIQLAIVHQESKFKAEARPPVKKVLGISMGRTSSAYGYAQATDEAWYDYQRQTGKWNAKRNNIKDALDFIGWYNHQSYKRLKIPKNDPFKQYLAYHEGQTGYQQRTYLKKDWLPPVAKKVANRSRLYARQYQQCN